MVLAPSQEKGVARTEVKQQMALLTREGRHRALSRHQGAWIPALPTCRSPTWDLRTICGLGVALPEKCSLQALLA